MATTTTLTQRNLDHHAALDARWRQAAAALTALELDRAESGFEALHRALEDHAGREDAHALPVYGRAAEAIGGPPRGGSLEIMDGEHRKLEELARVALEAVRSLREIAPHERRLAMLETLQDVLRLRSVLEHHTDRETRLVYPLLDAHASADERARVLAEVFDEAPTP